MGGASGDAVTFSVASGTGTISGSTLMVTGAGTIVVNANQAGNSNYAAAATVQRSITVNKASSTVTGPTMQPVSVVYGQTGAIPVNIAGQHSGTGIVAPSGSAGYSIVNSSGTSVASGSLSIASGAVSVPEASTLAPGVYTLTVSYAGDANYSAAQATVGLQVGQIQPGIAWTQPSSILYGTTLAGVLNAAAQDQSGSTPKPVEGTFTYLDTTTTVSSATVLPAGTYTLTVHFTPTDTTAYKTATGSVTLTVNKATPTVSLQSSVNPVLPKNAVTLTATVSSGISTPTGTVTFLDGTTALGTGPLVNGVGTLTTSTLAVGSHSITAVYPGDANFNGSTSSVYPQQVDDFDLSIATTGAGSTSQTIFPGGVATYNFTVLPTGAAMFSAAVQLSVTGLPTGATYTITPQTIAAGAGATNVTLTINAPGQTAMLHPRASLSPIAFALLLLPFSGYIRRRAGHLGRLAAVLLILLGGAAGMAALTGCGAGAGFFAQPQQIYTVTVTGTSGALQHSTTFTLTVQ